MVGHALMRQGMQPRRQPGRNDGPGLSESRIGLHAYYIIRPAAVCVWYLVAIVLYLLISQPQLCFTRPSSG